MVDRLAAICNTVIHQFKNDFYLTPLRLNRDLKYGPAAPKRVISPSMMRESSLEIPLPPMDWEKMMTCSGETSADSGDLPPKQPREEKEIGANFLARFLIQPNSPNPINHHINKSKWSTEKLSNSIK